MDTCCRVVAFSCSQLKFLHLSCVISVEVFIIIIIHQASITIAVAGSSNRTIEHHHDNECSCIQFGHRFSQFSIDLIASRFPKFIHQSHHTRTSDAHTHRIRTEFVVCCVCSLLANRFVCMLIVGSPRIAAGKANGT